MTDIALIPSVNGTAFDIAIADGQLVLDDGLRTAAIVSLFSDARASADDALPVADADRRGWWGDAFGLDVAQPIGSKFWLLVRAKAVGGTVAAARDHASAALAWFKGDAVARTVEVNVERQLTNDRGTERLAIEAIITRPDSPARERYDFAWEGTL